MEIKLNVDEKVLEPNSRFTSFSDQLKAFIHTLANAILDAIKSGQLKYALAQVSCEKCKGDTVEFQITFEVVIKLLVMRVVKKIRARFLYHDVCGCSYVRFDVV